MLAQNYIFPKKRSNSKTVIESYKLSNFYDSHKYTKYIWIDSSIYSVVDVEYCAIYDTSIVKKKIKLNSQTTIFNNTNDCTSGTQGKAL